jgi:putative hydrolase of the HAD superfamily
LIVPDAGFRAVLFDLDDTLFPQSAWLDGAWAAVAAAAVRVAGPDSGRHDSGPHDAGLHDAGRFKAGRFEAALRRVAGRGTAQGGIIDKALAETGLDVPVAPLVDVFRSHRPERLEPYPGVAHGLARLARTVPLGLVTDGEPGIQRGKVAALGLGPFFRAVVFSDELGRQRRKPDPAPFLAALEMLGVAAGAVVFVGDNPAKDVAGAAALGMTTIRVRTGEYAQSEASVPADHDVATVADALTLLDALLSPRSVGV